MSGPLTCCEVISMSLQCLDLSSITFHLRQLEINYLHWDCSWGLLFDHYINLTEELFSRAKRTYVAWKWGCHKHGDRRCLGRRHCLRRCCRPLSCFFFPPWGEWAVLHHSLQIQSFMKWARIKRMQWEFHSKDLALQNIIIAETVMSQPVILEEI
jgi:hypothetical protein